MSRFMKYVWDGLVDFMQGSAIHPVTQQGVLNSGAGLAMGAAANINLGSKVKGNNPKPLLNKGKGSSPSVNAPDLVGAAHKPKLTKPLKEMSNAELVQEVANRAEHQVGGIGAVPGIYKHKYAEKLLDKAQKMHGDRGLETEQRWANGDVWQPGIPLKGSVKLDVYDKNAKVVYDHKFVQQPGTGLKQNQIDRIQNQVGENVPVTEVNPNLIKK